MDRELQDILTEFPQRNPAWAALDTCFVVEASEMGLQPGISPNNLNVKDPWSRLFPCPPRAIINESHELVAWHFSTTVRGQEIECRIFND